MLLQIRKFLEREQLASSQQIAREFQMDIQALQPMLDFWLRKSVIYAYHEKNACQASCFKCKEPPVYYAFLRQK